MHPDTWIDHPPPMEILFSGVLIDVLASVSVFADTVPTAKIIPINANAAITYILILFPSFTSVLFGHLFSAILDNKHSD